jgi:hypothetical protein
LWRRSEQGLAIILYYLNLLESMMLHPGDMNFGGDSARSKACSAASAPPEQF